jgi:hypothetical protein
MHCYLTVQDVTLKQEEMPSYTTLLITSFNFDALSPRCTDLPSVSDYRTIRLPCWQHCNAYDVEQQTHKQDQGSKETATKSLVATSHEPHPANVKVSTYGTL